MAASDASPNDPAIIAHERAYKAFNVLLRWCMVVLGAGILTLTLWFATPAGFLGGVTVGVVAFALGYWVVVRHEAHQPLDVWKIGR